MPRRSARNPVPFIAETASASAEVIARRMHAFADPFAMGSARQRREAARMVYEKMEAAQAGTVAAWSAAAAWPFQWMQAGLSLQPWQPSSWMTWWSSAFDLWNGVGQAALRPARRAAVANRRRLRRAG